MAKKDVEAALAAAREITDPAPQGAAVDMAGPPPPDPQDPGPAWQDGPPPGGALPPIGAGPDAENPLARGAALRRNDKGNGRRLVLYYGDEFRHVPRLGWFRWDGRRWAADEDEIAVRRDAQDVSEKIEAEADFVALEEWQQAQLEAWRSVRAEFITLTRAKSDPAGLSAAQEARLERLAEIAEKGRAAEKARSSLARRHRDFALASGNSGRITNMLKEACTAVSTSIDAMNADPFLLNVENGTLRFSLDDEEEHAAAWGAPAKPAARVELLAHERAHMISKMCAAPYDPAVPAERFRDLLEEILPDDEVREFVQRWAGYSLLGITTEQKLVFCFGIGRNGKSTLIDILARVMADYAASIPIESLTGSAQRKGSDATPDLVSLPGTRFLRASEPEQGERLKEALLKQLTGGEPILIRRMQQEFVEITPEFKLTISGNHKPEIRGADDGIWRRVLIVPFKVQIPADRVDAKLPQRLWEERAGILAWMVEGALSYLQDGLRPPASVTAATEDYRRESDPIRTFLTEECEITGAEIDTESSADLRDAFNAWLLNDGLSPWGARTIGNQIKARAGIVRNGDGASYEPAKLHGNAGYRGLKLTETARDRIALYGDQLRGGA